MIPVSPSFELGAHLGQADQRQRLSETAGQFEAIFVRQMLSAARQAKIDDGGLFSSEGTNTFRQMMDDRFADILAENGSLGFGKAIEAQLSARLAPASVGPDKE